MTMMSDNMMPRRYIVDDRLIDEGDVMGVITPLWWEVSIYDGEGEMLDNLEQFTKEQGYVWAVQWYLAEVSNGGHDQFFYNHTGIVWEIALEGLRDIGCTYIADILEEAAQLLGGSPSPDRETRQQQLESHNPDFTELDNKLYENDYILEKALQQYIADNREAFYFNGIVHFPQQIAEEYGTEVTEEE